MVPSPDPIRGFIPKAYIVLKPGYTPSRDLAYDIFKFIRLNIAPYKRLGPLSSCLSYPRPLVARLGVLSLGALSVRRGIRALGVSMSTLRMTSQT